MTAAGAGDTSHLTLISRSGCELCEEMQAELAALGERLPLPPIDVVDVDADPLLARRYGLKVPVLLLGNTPIASARLDVEELLRLLRLR